MNKKFIDEVIGWYGTISIILAYALLSFQYLSSNELFYHILNGTGALGIIYISLKKGAYPPAILNIVWALIALFSIMKILFF